MKINWNPSKEEYTSKKAEFKEYGLVYYTPLEELINCLSHLLGVILGFIGLGFMIAKSTSTMSYLTSALFAFGVVILYGNSAIYHGTWNVKIKRQLRKIDHASVNLTVISSGIGICFLPPPNTYCYVALGLCYAIAIANLCMCLIDLNRLKVPTFLTNIANGALLFVAFFVNKAYVPQISIIFYGVGLLATLLGVALYGRKIKYVHSIFHVFVLIGTVLFYFATYFMLY